MTNQRHLRRRLHRARHGVRRRLRVPLISAAVIGVAAIGALPVSQAMSAATDGGPDRTTAMGLSAAAAKTAAGLQAKPSPAPTATTRTPAKPSPGKASTSPSASPKPAASKSAAPKKAKPAVPAKLELHYQYAVQINGWYCGPAATRIALTARGLYPSQDELATKLGTTENGTNSSADVARVLNAMTKTSFYQATSIPSKSVTTQQINQLQSDVVDANSHGYAVVMNVVGTGQDTNGNAYTFSGGHYIVVVGYQSNGRQVKIADSANGYSASYWMNVSDLANWAGTRGYAS